MKPIGLLVAAVALIGMTMSASAEPCIVADPTGTPLNIRNSPSTIAQIVGALKNGVAVSTGTSRGDWVQVVPQAGKSGWVYRKCLDCSQSTQKNAEPLIVPTNAPIDGNVILFACTSPEQKYKTSATRTWPRSGTCWSSCDDHEGRVAHLCGEERHQPPAGSSRRQVHPRHPEG
jgi:uncharacterized protein YraI